MAKLMVMLDSLLDLRLGVVEQRYPGLAEKLAENPQYYGRNYEDWSKLSGGRFTTMEFSKWYSERDVETLKHSRITHIVRYLSHLVEEHTVFNAVDEKPKKMEIELNTTGFDLSEEEKEAFVNGLIYFLDNPVLEVSAVDIPLAELTPKVLGDRYGGLVIYCPDDYLLLHRDALIAQPPRSNGMRRLSDFCLVGALLFKKPVTGLTESQRQQQIGMAKVAMLEFIGLDYIDASNFSQFFPKKVAEEDKPSNVPFRRDKRNIKFR